MFDKFQPILKKSYPLGVTIALPILMLFHLNISSDVLFYVSLCLFFSYQQRRELNKEIDSLKQEVKEIKNSSSPSIS